MSDQIIRDTFEAGIELPPIDYEQLPEPTLAWRALAGDTAAIDERSRRELTASSFHLPGKHDQKSHGKGGSGSNIAPISSEPVVSEVEAKLLNGGFAEIDPGHLDGLLRDLPNHASINLEHLRVTGSDNPGMYREHAREIPRKEMPQLPEDLEGATRFQQALGGVKSELIEVDPRELHLTQNELDSVKVGKLYGYIKDGGWNKDSLFYASREMDVLDGHHRFAGAAAAAATGSDVKVKVLKVDMPIDDLLAVANSVSGEKVGMKTGFTSRGQHFQDEDRPPPPSENEPWVWVEGQWYKIVTDTSDGVPSNLDYIHDAEKEPTTSSVDPDAITRRVFVSRWDT